MVPANLPLNKHPGAGAASAAQPHAPTHRYSDFFARFARNVSGLTAHPVTFVVAVLAVLGWVAFGPITHYSEIWQLWINTSTTILTFLMVFLLQNAQMRDTKAVHVKIDELIRAVQGARNELIDLENLSEAELDRYCKEFSRLHRHYLEAVERKRATQSRSSSGKEGS